MSRRSPAWVALLAILMAAGAPRAAAAQIRNAVSVTPTGASGALISFRGPEDEVGDCCSEFFYFMVVRGQASCLREAFPAAFFHGRAEASFEEFGDVELNGEPKRGKEIGKGDIITIAIQSLPECAAPYRGAVIFERSFLESDTERTTVGQFELRVTSDGSLAVTGFNLPLVGGAGAILIVGRLCGRRRLRRGG
jgi:hypothetical protein